MSEASLISDQSIAARLERLPYSRWHITVTAFLGVAIFFDGFDALTTAYVLPVLIREWHIPLQNVGGLISIANVGQALGALFFGWLAERIGRVRTAQITIALYAVMSLVCAFTSNYQELFWCRFFEGIGLGGEIPVASTYISEILRADRRGGSFLGYQIIFPVGLLGAGIIGAIVVPSFGWQWMFIIGAVPALISFVLRRYCPESPRWLAQKGRLDEAEKVMAEIERKVSHDGRDPLPPVVPIKTPPLGNRTRWQELFQGRYLRRTLIVWVLWASTYLVSQGLQSWIPTLYREVYHLSLQQSVNYAVAAPVGTRDRRVALRAPHRPHWAAALVHRRLYAAGLRAAPALASRLRDGFRHDARLCLLHALDRLGEHEHLPLYGGDLSDAYARDGNFLGDVLAAPRRDNRPDSGRLRPAGLWHRGRLLPVLDHHLYRPVGGGLHDRDDQARAGGGVALRRDPTAGRWSAGRVFFLLLRYGGSSRWCWLKVGPLFAPIP